MDTRALVQTFRGHTKAIADCKWSSCGNYVLTASDDNLILLWEVKSGTCAQIFKGHTSAVLSCCMNTPNDNLIASGSYDETVRLWSTTSGACLAIIPVHSDPITSVSFSHDGTLLLTSSYDGYCRVWDVATCSCLKTLEKLGGEIVHANFLPNSADIFLATSAGIIVLHEFSRDLSHRVSPGCVSILIKHGTNSTGSTFVFIQVHDKEILVSTCQRIKRAMFCNRRQFLMMIHDRCQPKLCVSTSNDGELLAICTTNTCQVKVATSA